MWFLIAVAALSGQPSESKENLFLFEKTHSSLEACLSYAKAYEPQIVQYIFTEVFPNGTPVQVFCIDKSSLAKMVGQGV